MANQRVVVVVVTIVVTIVIVVSFIIGFVSVQNPTTKSGTFLDGVSDKIIKDGDEGITQRLIKEISANSIKGYLKNLTSKPHLAGTPADLTQATQIKEEWESYGLSPVVLNPYRVMLSYPDRESPNLIQLINDKDEIVFSSQAIEKPLRPEHNYSDVAPPFNAYSASGTPQGDLVYINYGRQEDFAWITQTKGFNLTGKICIARYGKIYRGSKALLAENYGCAGLIIYSDPADYAKNGEDNVYPNSEWLPGTGVQRGSCSKCNCGDPTTPGYPSIDGCYRVPDDKLDVFKIPIQPIGYDDALEFLGKMAGEEVPEGWKGTLNITYRLGPGLSQVNWSTRMRISTRNKMATTYNVIGYISGEIEPDRYVILGNHRDAWVFGSVDPSSGKACLMEVARVFGKLYKEGWRPRRTIIFISWGAEEYGLVGSREFVEQFGKNLQDRVVAYLNMDSSVQGQYAMFSRSVPLMYKVLYETTKKIPNPNPDEIKAGRKSVYDTWVERRPRVGRNGKTFPHITRPASGSDFAPFTYSIGVPITGMRYMKQTGGYALYHSAYETMHLMETFLDPEFKYHEAMACVWGELARALSDSYVLPIEVSDYAHEISVYVQQLEDAFGANFTRKNITLDYNFDETVTKINKNNPLHVRRVNDQMVKMERHFIDPMGLPNRPLYRHVIFSPNEFNAYSSGSGFPGISDEMFQIELEETPERLEVVKRHLSVISFLISSAASSLEDVSDFVK
ncbi:unnamed protein product [Owenia fusiformis]|uniref:Glutamate carboxypeptidase 2 n=1 Tax=Owenia fusiformis TaxID=6347 RepID=A0A8S4PZH1_OWEFU|nr:unnamed protein product [Owenia fusiformis]